jgi:hypothetical protein
MKRPFFSAGGVAVVLIVVALFPVPARCQTAPMLTAQPPLDSTPISADSQSAAAAAPIPTDSSSGFARLLRDVGGDYKGFFSKGVALRLGIGGAAAGIAHIWDSDIANEVAEPLPPPTELLDGGDFYGGPSGQWPLAIGWWAIGHFSHNAAGADAGRDLLRAQISAASWTYLIKVATNRQRPNGDPRAFPSGHTSATFATATVLQQHYGWKVGVPFYLLGVYAGASRVTAEKHWTSDVVFGAAVGVASGYTVTRRFHTHPVTLSPAIYPGGVGVSVNLEP